MKTALIFSGTGPILVMMSYPSLTDRRFLDKLAQKGISKFIAFEVDIERAKTRYGARFDCVADELVLVGEDMRVLDYNGYTAFHSFSFDELGEPIRYDMTKPAMEYA